MIGKKCLFVYLFIYFKDFIHKFLRDTEREAETQAEGEAGSMQEPDMGLDPRTPGSHTRLQAGAQPLSHRGCPTAALFIMAKIGTQRKCPWMNE